MQTRHLTLLAALTVGFGMLAAALGGPGPQTPTPRPYPLGTCPVSGEDLGSMGAPVVRVYDGREVRFCCKSCIKKFEAKQADYWAKVDEEIIAEQLVHYPLSTCVVSGDSLTEDGEDVAVNVVIDNRLVRLCCKGCKKDLAKDPAAFMTKLDTSIADAQRDAYPLKTCLVSGEELGGMGEPFELVFENRLVRLCCDHCIEKFNANPRKFMASLDAAYADAQRDAYPLDTCVVSGEKLGGMGEPVELVAGNRLVRFCCEKCVAKFRQDPAKYLAKLDGPGH